MHYKPRVGRSIRPTSTIVSSSYAALVLGSSPRCANEMDPAFFPHAHRRGKVGGGTRHTHS
jgi:hypothetical protein